MKVYNGLYENSEDLKILTAEGWKTWDGLNSFDLIATVVQNNLQFLKPMEIVKSSKPMDMIRFDESNPFRCSLDSAFYVSDERNPNAFYFCSYDEMEDNLEYTQRGSLIWVPPGEKTASAWDSASIAKIMALVFCYGERFEPGKLHMNVSKKDHYLEEFQGLCDYQRLEVKDESDEVYVVAENHILNMSPLVALRSDDDVVFDKIIPHWISIMDVGAKREFLQDILSNIGDSLVSQRSAELLQLTGIQVGVGVGYDINSDGCKIFARNITETFKKKDLVIQKNVDVSTASLVIEPTHIIILKHCGKVFISGSHAAMNLEIPSEEEVQTHGV